MRRECAAQLAADATLFRVVEHAVDGAGPGDVAPGADGAPEWLPLADEIDAAFRELLPVATRAPRLSLIHI